MDGSSVNSGTSITLTATPNTGYEIKEWKVNGVAVTSGNTLTRTISDNTTITVEFEAILGVMGVEEFPIYEMNVGDKTPSLPETLVVTLSTLEEISVPVIWDTSLFNGDIADNYVIVGTFVLPVGVENPMNIKAEYLVDVFDAPVITTTVLNANTLTISADMPIFIGDIAPIDIGKDISKLEFIQMLFNDPELDETVIDEMNVEINTEINSIEIVLLEDAIGTYMTSGFASDGTEFGFYYDEGGIKSVIEGTNSEEVYFANSVTGFEVLLQMYLL